MMVQTSTQEVIDLTKVGTSCEPSFCTEIGIKHRQSAHDVWQKHGSIVGVVCLKSENSKQRQIGVITWYKYGVLVAVICLNFNNYSINLKVVIIHGSEIHC